MSNEVLKAIKERRSVRSYMSTSVDPRLLDQVLEAGTWAASAMNRQPARIVCVTKEEDRRQLSRMNAAIMGSDKDPYYGAPCIIIVLVDSASATGREDGSLVLGNMMLAAHSLGLGSCWINREREMFATDEGKALLKKSERLRSATRQYLKLKANPERATISSRSNRRADSIKSRCR